MVTGEKQAARIRGLYLKTILRQDVAFFDKETNTGEVVGRMSGDTVLIQDAMGEKVGKFLQLIATFIGGFVIAFIKGWLLTVVMLSTLPLLVVSGAAMAFIIGRMASRGQTAYAKAAHVVEQTIGSIRTEPDGNKVVNDIIFSPGSKKYRFCKHISKQRVLGLPEDLMKKGKHFILIRNPLDILPSFDKVVPPSFFELGLAELVCIYNELSEIGKPPPVIDAAELEKDPEATLRGLCNDLEIPFQHAMLSPVSAFSLFSCCNLLKFEIYKDM